MTIEQRAEAKTARDFIKSIPVNKANLQHIAETGVINGSLLLDTEVAMEAYATHQTASLEERVKKLEGRFDKETVRQMIIDAQKDAFNGKLRGPDYYLNPKQQ